MSDDQRQPCPWCGGPTYECDAPHTDGKRYRHCRRFSSHNFEVIEERA